jgi:hypothetical protein
VLSDFTARPAPRWQLMSERDARSALPTASHLEALALTSNQSGLVIEVIARLLEL